MLRRSLIAVLASLLLFKSGLFVFATAVPIFYLFAVYGRREGLLNLAFLAAVAAAGFAFYDRLEAVYFAYFMFAGLILGEGFVRREEFFKFTGLAVLMPWVAVMGVFIVLQFGFSVPITHRISADFGKLLAQIATTKDVTAALGPQQLAYLQNNISEIADFSVKVLPSMLLLFSAAAVSLTFLFTRALARRTGVFARFDSLSAEKFPFFPVWMTIAFVSCYLLNEYFLHVALLRFLAMNGLVCSAGFHFLQGLFVVSFWLKRWKSPFFKLAVYGVIVFFLQIMSVVIIGLGLSDHWLEFRKNKATT